MPLPFPEPGLVVSYSYLWDAEHSRGLEEGVKDRPCVVILLTERADTRSVVTVVPVTHAPSADDDAVELPPATKRRLGLDDARSWVVSSVRSIASYGRGPIFARCRAASPTGSITAFSLPLSFVKSPTDLRLPFKRRGWRLFSGRNEA